MSPSSHWMVTIAPSVVLDISLTVASEGITGAPQSTMEHNNRTPLLGGTQIEVHALIVQYVL
jgi:hypothetical protein